MKKTCDQEQAKKTGFNFDRPRVWRGPGHLKTAIRSQRGASESRSIADRGVELPKICGSPAPMEKERTV